MNDGELTRLLDEAAAAVVDALADHADWGLTPTSDEQHHSDLAADAAALAVLDRPDVGVVSEESGTRRPDADLVVVIDPLDGSSNAAQGIPWYGTSLCAVDADGPRAAVVVDLPRGRFYRALRGGGATCDERVVGPSVVTQRSDALVVLNGFPGRHLGWRQYRALGAAALDLCAVADGTVDALVDCSPAGLAPWDYLGALLVCTEAGAAVTELDGRDLATVSFDARRRVVAAATEDLLVEMVDAIGVAPS